MTSIPYISLHNLTKGNIACYFVTIRGLERTLLKGLRLFTFALVRVVNGEELVCIYYRD